MWSSHACFKLLKWKPIFKLLLHYFFITWVLYSVKEKNFSFFSLLTPSIFKLNSKYLGGFFPLTGCNLAPLGNLGWPCQLSCYRMTYQMLASHLIHLRLEIFLFQIPLRKSLKLACIFLSVYLFSRFFCSKTASYMMLYTEILIFKWKIW